jgi:hypothetical protein
MKPEFWMKWDLDSLEGVKTKYFLLGFPNKDEALGTFLRLVTMLYQRDEPWLTLDPVFIATYCHESGSSEEHLRRVVDRLVESGLFCFKQNEANASKAFTSNRVLEELKAREERLAELSAKRSEAGRKGGKNSRASKQSEANSSKAKQIKPDKNRLEEKRVSNNTINSPDGEDPKKPRTLKLQDLKFPEHLKTERCKQAIIEWLAHKKARRESYKSVDSINRLLSHWQKFSEAEFLESVDRSIRNNWAGLHDPDKRRAGPTNATDPIAKHEARMQYIKETHQKLLEEESANENPRDV